MRLETLKELFEKGLLTGDQFARLEATYSKRIISVFYDLRTLLYFGVMLFTTGVGILIYQNIGNLGHLLSIAALVIFALACFLYAFMKTGPYSNSAVNPPSAYFDYILLMGCLVFISVQGYLQFQFGVLTDHLEWSTLATAFLFFLCAYRFDHLGVLSLAITAVASFWSISVSPQKWYEGDFFESADLHNKALIFGAVMTAIAMGLDKKGIKSHFTFTYVNFSVLIFLCGALSGMFINDDDYAPYLVLVFAGSGFAVFYAMMKKSFLFLLYAFVFAYIGTTFLLADTVLGVSELWFLYFFVSCGGFVYFIIAFRNYFKRTE